MSQSAKLAQTTVLVLDQSNTLSFAAAVDPLRAANRHAHRQLYEWGFATPGTAPVTLTSGVSLPAAPLHRVVRCDLLLIVAGFALETQATPALLASIRRLGTPETTVAGIDGGAWIMAQAGILDGHHATTHWEDLDKFADAFPNVTTVNTRFQVSGTRLTCAGASPALDMMLDLIAQRHSPALAAQVAGGFIYDTQDGTTRQHRRLAPELRSKSSIIARAHDLMEDARETPYSMQQVAALLGISPRSLQHQFQQNLGTTPQAYYLNLRLTEAEHLVRHSDLAIQQIALATGFSSQSGFSRAFRAAFGQSARQMRKT